MRLEIGQLKEQIHEIEKTVKLEDDQQRRSVEALAGDERQFAELSRKVHVFENGGDNGSKLRQVEGELTRLQQLIENHEGKLAEKQEQRRLYDTNMSQPRQALENIRMNR